MSLSRWGFAGFLLIALLCSACGGSGQNSLDGDLNTLNADNRNTSDFSLSVWDETFLDEGQAEFSLSTRRIEGGVEVAVLADKADGLKALYFDLGYDAEKFAPQFAEAAETLGSSDELLSLSVIENRGRVYHGQVLVRPQDQAGFSGSAVVARLLFKDGPAPQTRISSAAPTSAASAAQLSFESETGMLVWGYASQGDYDQNSETNIADLTPLGIHFRKDGPFAYESVESVVDGDGNGEINVSDITPIGINFQRRVTAYNVYLSSEQGDYPAGPAATSSISALAEVDYGTFDGVRGDERIMFAHTFTEAVDNAYCWVRPSDAGTEGTPSSMVQVNFSGVVAPPTNLAPVARISAPVTSGNVPFAVTFNAGTSTDADGSIVKYEWDLDGSPGFELDGGGTAETGQVYDEPGVYVARVRVTDNEGATASASMFISANVAGNTAPVAVISADTLSGEAPLTVNFDASESSDSDGTIIRYEWDVDGDGNFDVDTGTEPTASHTYSVAGNYDVAVKVTDDMGSSDIAYISEMQGGTGSGIEVDGSGTGGNQDPVVVLSVDPLSGDLPLTINFDASLSSDPEGGILTFQWDFNGDGIFDLNSGSDGTVSFLYTIAGSFDVHVKVSDPDGGVTIKSLSDLGIDLIDVIGGGGDPNQDPIAALSLDVNLGTAPLTVNLDASASIDPDGEIVKFEWDFDGDGIFDLDSDIDATVSTVFLLHGIFNSVLRVTDDDGATDLISVLDLLDVGIHVNAAPVADFDVDSLLGILTLLVNFDASASVDEDGAIVEVAWDFDGDGEFDEDGGLLGLLTSHLYLLVGVYDPVLRITDDFGAVDFCSLSETGSDLIEVSLL